MTDTQGWASVTTAAAHVGEASRGEILAQLIDAYEEAKTKADAANELVETINSTIKSVALQDAPTSTKAVHIQGSTHRYRLAWYPSHRIDTKRLRRVHPELAEAFSTDSGSWQLRKAAD